jgi:hypothetical protein
MPVLMMLVLLMVVLLLCFLLVLQLLGGLWWRRRLLGQPAKRDPDGHRVRWAPFEGSRPLIKHWQA